MSAHVIDDFQVLGRYRVMVLDRDVCGESHASYRINGQTYHPIALHQRRNTNDIPLNYIAIRSTESFKGASVEII